MSLHVRACLVDNLLKHLGRILLALIVTYHANLYALFVAKILMVMHLTRDKGICTCFQRLVE